MRDAADSIRKKRNPIDGAKVVQAFGPKVFSMRLLILTPEFDGRGGGIITFYRELAPALSAKGVQVRVIEGSAIHTAADRTNRFREGICVETLELDRLARWKAQLPAFAGAAGLRAHLAAAWAMWEQADYGRGCDIVEACDWGLLFVPPA